MEARIITGKQLIDPRTPEGRKALSFLTIPTRTLLELLGIDPDGPQGRTHYSKAELCLMCVERGLKRPMV